MGALKIKNSGKFFNVLAHFVLRFRVLLLIPLNFVWTCFEPDISNLTWEEVDTDFSQSGQRNNTTQRIGNNILGISIEIICSYQIVHSKNKIEFL